MEGKRGCKALMSFFLALFVSQMSIVMCRSLEELFTDQKNYYSPDPHVLTPPTHALSPPKHSHKTPSCPPPPTGESGCSCGPSHSGGSGTTSPPSHGGGYYNNPPPSPTVGSTPPTIPINPPTTPTTPVISTPPSTPYIPVDPNTPPLTPTTPVISSPPSPPFIPVDPNTPLPGTCTYWSTNPTMIWGIFGYWATVGGLFGPVTTMPFGRNLSVQEALANTHTDGFGALYREGMASFLNSLVNKKFPFTTPEVRRAFTSALASEKVAAQQGKLFKMANEGKLKKQH